MDSAGFHDHDDEDGKGEKDSLIKKQKKGFRTSAANMSLT